MKSAYRFGWPRRFGRDGTRYFVFRRFELRRLEVQGSGISRGHWNGLKASTAAWSALVLLLGLTACDPNAAGDGRSKNGDGGDEDSAAMYVRYCAACHGVDGLTVANNDAPNLNSQALLRVADDEFLRASIAEGRPGANGRPHPGVKMSAYASSEGGPLTDDQIGQIVDYVAQWRTEEKVFLDPTWRSAGDIEAGRTVWDRECAACHGDDGWAEGAPRLAGETFQRHASDDFIRRSIELGRPEGGMPGFRLEPDELEDVVAFVRSLGALDEDGATGADSDAASGADEAGEG